MSKLGAERDLESGPVSDPAFRKREHIRYLGGGVFGSKIGAPRACPRPEEMRGLSPPCPFLH